MISQRVTSSFMGWCDYYLMHAHEGFRNLPPYSQVSPMDKPQSAAASREKVVGPRPRGKSWICLANEIDNGALGEGTKKPMTKHGIINSVIESMPWTSITMHDSANANLARNIGWLSENLALDVNLLILFSFLTHRMNQIRISPASRYPPEMNIASKC